MSDLQRIKGLGEQAEKLLAKVGITSLQDLLDNIPRKYEDYSVITPISKLAPGKVTIRATLQTVTQRYARRGFHITEATASDETGTVRIMWFNQPYRANGLKRGEEYFFSGEFARSYRFLGLDNPACELVSTFPLHTARLVPQYRVTKGLTVHALRRYTKAAFALLNVPETLPAWLVQEKSLVSRREAAEQMHFPSSTELMAAARRRIGFEELFEMSLASALNKRDFAAEKAQYIPFNEEVVVAFVRSLPFTLTDDQRRCSWQILQDMTKGSPMNVLLEGDVGSGKTVVGAMAMVDAAAGGFQSAFMAPTELLARQHYENLKKLLGTENEEKIVFLSGSVVGSARRDILEQIQSGAALYIVGTHALFQEKVNFAHMGLVIIDEQHRFGVEQRKKLQGKAKLMPHVLHMTATPIPRSIALTLYGELDVLLLKQKPAGRQEITTEVWLPEMREKLYKEHAAGYLSSGNQVYVVCPLIDEQEEKPVRSLSVTSIAKQVKQWLPKCTVEILHGKMKADEKEAIMAAFVAGKIDVLVATTVIEVGVDVANATVMVVEGADRFGLAQLHQLRGRVGRGSDRSACYLVQSENSATNKRLSLIEQESDGFKLADYDLELRGPGAIYGTAQHGALDLRVAKITDVELIQEAKQAAQECVLKGENLVQYPQLLQRVNHLRAITNLN